MLKKLKALITCLIAAAASFFITYEIYKPQNQINNIPQVNDITKDSIQVSSQTSDRIEQNKINEFTKIIYEYYYNTDDYTREVETKAPYFLIGMTQQQLQNYSQDWVVQSFSPERVVLRTTIENKSANNYIIGVHDGYVAVFYEEEINGISLSDITDTPVSSLPVEEQQKLERGIYVKGEFALNRLLEDYGS